MEPVPTVGTSAMSRAIRDFRQSLPEVERSKQRYAPRSPRWAEILAEENASHIQRYDGRYPSTSRHNIDKRYAFWEGRTFPDVMAECRV